MGLTIHYLRKRRVGGIREVLYGYLYLKHLVQLWTGDWVNNMKKMDEAVAMKICFDMSGGKKRLVRPF